MHHPADFLIRSTAARWLAAALLAASMSDASASAPDANTAAALNARYAILKDQLRQTPFRRPLVMDSSESSDGVTGEIHALINYPFTAVSAALIKPAQWCDILILHLNTKYCHAATVNQATMLDVSIGKKHDQPLDQAYRVDFAYHLNENTPQYLQVQLSAVSGPISTRNYRIVLEAIPLEKGQTFMRLSYAYDFGFTGRLAMQTYLATVGSSKVGFTIVGRQDDGQPKYVGGMRGLVERNTMRYYLAIEAFMGALSTLPPARIEKSLRDWYASSEGYPRQLHEMAQDDYLVMKRKEYLRQQTAIVAAAVQPAN